MATAGVLGLVVRAYPIGLVPASAWGAVLDAQGQPRDPEEAGVVELTALLRQGPHGDQLRTAARIVHGQRRRKIRIPETWPWAQQLATCLRTALALPPPAPC